MEDQIDDFHTGSDPELQETLAHLEGLMGPVIEVYESNDPQEVSLLQKRLRDVQEHVTERRTRITSYLQRPRTNSELDETITPSLTYEEAVSTAKNFIEIPVNDPSTYIDQTREFITSAQDTVRSVSTQESELDEKIYQSRGQLERIERDLKKINESGRLSRATNFLERRALVEKKERFSSEIEKLEISYKALSLKRTVLNSQLNTLFDRRQVFVKQEVIGEIKAIADEYGALGEELLTDDTLVHDIQEVYIENVLIPEIDKQIASGLAKPEDKEQYLRYLRQYLVASNKPHASLIDLEREYTNGVQSLTGLRLSGGGLDGPLLARNDRRIVADIMAHYLAPDMQELFKQIEKHQIGYPLQQAFFNAFSYQLYTPAFSAMQNPELLLQDAIASLATQKRGVDIPKNMDLWDGARNSKTIHELFGPVVQDMDQEMYQVILKNLATDRNGVWALKLKQYPTPEVVRRLVILVSSEYSSYNRGIADFILGQFAKRENWHQILDAAEELTPQLHDARELLETWDYERRHDVYNDMKPIGERLIRSVLIDDASDETLTELCKTAASEGILLDLLVQQGVITSEDAEIFQSTEEILFKAGGIPRDRRFTRVDASHFIPVLRARMLALVRAEDTDKDVPPHEAIRRMGQLARLISQNQDDIDKLDYYSDRQLIDDLVAQNFTNEEADLLLRANEICPALETDYSLRQTVLNFSDVFLEEEALGLLVPITEAYQGREKVREELLILAAIKKIDLNRVLQLSTTARDIIEGPFIELALDNWEICLINDEDVNFFRSVTNNLENESGEFLELYQEAVRNKLVSPESRDKFLENYTHFSEIHTFFSPERATQLEQVSQTPFGKAVIEVVPDETHQRQILLDYACYVERFEASKIALLQRVLVSGISQSKLQETCMYLRWLPDSDITPDDSLESLRSKYKVTQKNFEAGFSQLFLNSNSNLSEISGINGLTNRMEDICTRFNIPTIPFVVDGIHIRLPKDFIKSYRHLRRMDPTIPLAPSLSAFVINHIIRSSTAYTVEDALFSQIGETEDRTGRRRSKYTSEKLLEEMEENIAASLRTWTTAINYQAERPNSPVFIIANERTGPADVAAEYLPDAFAQEHRIAQGIDYENFFDWFKANEETINELYEKYLNSEDLSDQIPSEALQMLQIDDHLIVPIYRLKIPSSLNAAVEEPEGIDTVINFMKLTSILGGRTLFMDESTRSAPRSIECLYNILNRRQKTLGGVSMRLFGKINNATGQNTTILTEVQSEQGRMEIAFIDPWESKQKSVADDSEGFVPKIRGKGVVEIIRPSHVSISPYGLSTIQDYWKQLIATEVAARYDQFVTMGSGKAPKSVYKPTIESVQSTQEELTETAFSQTYRALILDLDGTIGLGGQYDEDILRKVKVLAQNGVRIVFATSRSQIDHPEYSGSTQSLVEQLGDLTDEQRANLYLATENAGVISSLDQQNDPEVHFELSEDVVLPIETYITDSFPSLKIYQETASLVIRDFDKAEKQTIIDNLSAAFKRMQLPVVVMTDSKGAIHIRSNASSKRNVLNWLESKGINLNEIAKIGDSPDGNDRSMLIGTGAFNVGNSRDGTAWTIHRDENGGGIKETSSLLDQLQFATT